MAGSQKYRKVFCEYQRFAEEDADKREVKRLEMELYARREECRKLEEEISDRKSCVQQKTSQKKQQEEELFSLQEKTQQEEEKQENLWKEQCRKLGFSEEKARELLGEDFRTQQEITESLDAKLDKIEQILAGYIIQEKKQMDKITAIIDDPGGR